MSAASLIVVRGSTSNMHTNGSDLLVLSIGRSEPGMPGTPRLKGVTYAY
jgi:hypothetical protein